MRPLNGSALLLLLLLLPYARAHAAGTLGQVAPTEQAEQPPDSQDRDSRHHPLIQVRFVLVSPPREAAEVPAIDLGDGRSELSLPRSGMQATLLDPARPPPNVLVCPGPDCGW